MNMWVSHDAAAQFVCTHFPQHTMQLVNATVIPHHREIMVQLDWLAQLVHLEPRDLLELVERREKWEKEENP